MVRPVLPALILLAALPGCARLAALFPDRDAPQTEAAAGAEALPETAEPAVRPPPPPAGARTAAAFDTVSEADRTAALDAPAADSERLVGEVAVSLGNPGEPGLWLRSSRITAPGPGRVVGPDGTSLAVDLYPGDGPAQLSLSAFRALNLPLTALPVVAVYAR